MSFLSTNLSSSNFALLLRDFIRLTLKFRYYREIKSNIWDWLCLNYFLCNKLLFRGWQGKKQRKTMQEGSGGDGKAGNRLVEKAGNGKINKSKILIKRK